MRHLVFLLLSLSAMPAFAENESAWWKFWQKTTEGVNSVTNHPEISKVFSSEERSILNDYLRNRALDQGRDTYSDNDHDKDKKHKNKHKKKKALPPGLKKKVERGGELPPGWQKKVAKGEVMDKDLYLASQRLPRDVVERLPNGPTGTTIRRIDERVVRVMDATGVILDVLTGNKK